MIVDAIKVSNDLKFESYSILNLFLVLYSSNTSLENKQK